MIFKPNWKNLSLPLIVFTFAASHHGPGTRNKFPRTNIGLATCPFSAWRDASHEIGDFDYETINARCGLITAPPGKFPCLQLVSCKTMSLCGCVHAFADKPPLNIRTTQTTPPVTLKRKIHFTLYLYLVNNNVAWFKCVRKLLTRWRILRCMNQLSIY